MGSILWGNRKSVKHLLFPVCLLSAGSTLPVLNSGNAPICRCLGAPDMAAYMAVPLPSYAFQGS